MNDSKINLEQLIGKQVQLVLHTEAFKNLSVGFGSQRFYATISGLDGFGLWIQDPDYTVTPSHDSNGRFLPAAERKEETYNAHILLLWSYIQTIIYIPDRQGVPPGTDEEGRIGFIPKRSLT